MDIIQYTDDHERFRTRLRAFLAKEVTPHVDQWERDGIVPKNAWRKMGRAGFLCMAVSPEFGGLGADFRHSVIVAEELTRTGHAGLAASLHSDVVVPYIDTFGSEAICKKYLPGCVTGDTITALAMTEPGAGSDLAGISTTADEKDGMVVLNGAKTFISNGINADLVIVAARDPKETNSYQAIIPN